MKYDESYLKTLYNNHTIEEFLELVDEGKVDDPYIRAIISTLRRSTRTLKLQFNPISIQSTQEKSQETNQPHK